MNRLGGWVGGWVGLPTCHLADVVLGVLIERLQIFGLLTEEGEGHLGGWVGGWVGLSLVFHVEVDRWVGGWVGGWVGRRRFE